MPVLSICIPVFNRKNTLKTLLDSIIDQLEPMDKEKVEIAISDNASTDGTEGFIKQYITQYPDIRIIYNKNKKNLGADKNYIKAVEMTHGAYAWIIGSDDALYGNAIKRMLKEIQSQDTVYLASRDNYDTSLSQFLGKQNFFKNTILDSTTVLLNNRENWDFYLNLCTELGGMMSYLSSIVFKKKSWDSIQDYKDFIGTAYVHVYIILKFLLTGDNTSIRLLSEPFVKCRLGNDSFLETYYQRVMLDFNGYIKLSQLFEDPLLRQDFLSILKKTYPIIPAELILRMKKKEWGCLADAMRVAGYNEAEVALMGRMQKHKFLTLLLHGDKVLEKMKRKRSKVKQEEKA